jgi:CRISPR-associated protein Csm3
MLKKNFTIRIKVVTGLHIGIGSDKPEIGGVDNPFIKDPISKLPYIPGSSLKGKLRSLLETEAHDFTGKVIEKAFGGDDNSPTRFIFRDINLVGKHRDLFLSGKYQTEIKTEIKIDRKTGTATPGALRTTERIPPTIEFEGNILVRSIDKDDEELNISMLKKAIELLNNDYLGGSGSRGYGAVEVSLI